MNQQELIEQLETLVDKSSLADTLFALARMCNEKGEHLRINWQDNQTAKTWDIAARNIDKIADKVCC